MRSEGCGPARRRRSPRRRGPAPWCAPLPRLPVGAAPVRREAIRTPSGVSRNRASSPPIRAVMTSNGGTASAPAHKLATANSLTSPPPISPRENSTAPPAKTAAAQPIVARAAEMAGGLVSRSRSHNTHNPPTSRLGMTRRRRSTIAAASISAVKPASQTECGTIAITGTSHRRDGCRRNSTTAATWWRRVGAKAAADQA